MTINKEELKKYIQKKHDLLREVDRKEKTEEEAGPRIKKLQEYITEQTKKIIEEENKK